MNEKDFPILKKNLVYLDNSATTQKPRQVIKALTDYYENYNSNVHRGIHKLSMQSTLAYDDARQSVANFISADFEEIIFTSGTTESLNFLARTLVNEGDEIVLSEMEHHSNIVPWQQIAKEKNAKVRFIPITKDFKLDLKKAKEIINEKTKIVSLTHMSNVLGTINPIKKIANLVHNVNGLMVVDAAQSVPHFKVDVKDLGCDFLAFSGHKMCGPTGIGVLYGKKKLLEKIEPFKFGGGMIKEVCYQNSSWADLPHRFEAGTPNISGAIGLAAGVKYLQNVGMENIENHGMEITKYVLEKFSTFSGLKLIGPGNVEDRGPVFSFNLEGIHSHDLSESLDEENIAVRAGNHCAMPLMNKLNVKSAVRASFYFYNTKQEVDLLVDALSQLINPIDRNEIASNLTEEQEIYKENIIDHYKNPHNKKELFGCSISHKELNPICGDEITIYLQIDNGVVQDVTFTGDGCAISQASVSMLTDYVKGMSVSEVKEVNSNKVLELLGIPISHTRIKCALLSLKTVQEALKC